MSDRMNIYFKFTRQQPISGSLLFHGLLLMIGFTTTTTTLCQASPNELPNTNNNPESLNLIVNGTSISNGSSGGGGGGNSIPFADGSLQVSNFYSNAQAQKFRVNVSNVCEKNQMRATIRLNRPFYGLIHTKDKRRRAACSLEGNGELSYSMEISYTLNPFDANHCGVVSHQLQPPRHQNGSALIQPRPQLTLSVVLVVRLHKSIEFSDDRYFLLSCANRCSKPDCSASNAAEESVAVSPSLGLVTSGGAKAAPSRSRSPIVTSESITLPMFRINNALDPHNRSAPEQTDSGGWTSEKCDTMLDLKFQWLVKLCWVLTTLLVVMLCAALYLCLNLGKAAEKRLKQQREKRNLLMAKGIRKSMGKSSGSSSNESSTKSMSRGSKQVIYKPPPQTELASWSATNTGMGIVGQERDNNHLQNLHLQTQMRNEANNLYLAKQQQRHLILANLNLMAAAASSSNNERHQTAVTDQAARHLVLGRSAEPFHKASHQPLEARVVRRRSIGGSAALLDHNDPRGDGCPANQQVTTKLSASQRAKSRSQTTIHYDQGQDPFKTVPFNYANNGYQSDSGNSNCYLATGSVGMEAYKMPPTSRVPAPAPEARLQSFTSNHLHTSGETIVHSSSAVGHPPPSNGANTMTRQVWTHLKPTFVPSQQVEMIQVQGAKKLITSHSQQQQRQEEQQQQSAQQCPSSQFDPQNSRQLINLLQHKHRQQIEQANITVASMQSPEMFTERQPPTNLNLQHANMPASSRLPWR